MCGWSANQIFVYEGTQRLVAQWARCTENKGDYVEKILQLYSLFQNNTLWLLSDSPTRWNEKKKGYIFCLFYRRHITKIRSFLGTGVAYCTSCTEES